MYPRFKMEDDDGIYVDNAASTKMFPEVIDAMRPYMESYYGNPSSPYSFGRRSREAIEEARDGICRILGCASEELYFTSGGTESNNWAVHTQPYDIILMSAVEHPSVSEAVIASGRQYAEIPVDKDGIIDLVVLQSMLEQYNGKNILVSVQHANPETGVMQPIAEIVEIAHEYSAKVHTDAVQSFCKIDWTVFDLKADMITISSRKIHGPGGSGALYINRELDVEPFIFGGGQENGLRSGTPDTASIVGFAEAALLSSDLYKNHRDRLGRLCDGLVRDLNGYYENVVQNGDKKSKLPHIINFTIPDVDANLVCAIMDSEFNVMCSTGSACAHGKGPSKTLSAMGANTKSSFRISLSPDNTDDEICLLYNFFQKAIWKAEEKESV